MPVEYDRIRSIGAPECGVPSSDCGNPINTSIGNKHQKEVDLVDVDSLGFYRYYNSDVSTRTYNLGVNWTHGFNRRLIVSGDGMDLESIRPDGSAHSYKKVSGGWVGGAGVVSELFDASGARTGWKLSGVSSSDEHYDSLGRLAMLYLGDGQGELHFEYHQGEQVDGQSLYNIQAVFNDKGRYIRFDYSLGGRLSAVYDSAGLRGSYSYDTIGRLISYTSSGGDVRSYVYNELNNTSGAHKPWLLTGVEVNGVRVSTYRYDANGRAIESVHAGDASRYLVDYIGDDVARVTFPDGGIEERSFQIYSGLRRLTEVARFCTDCPAGDVTSYTYNDNGSLNSISGPNGAVTKHEYSSGGLLTKMSEAYGSEIQRSHVFGYTAPGRKTSYRIEDELGKVAYEEILNRDGRGSVVSIVYGSSQDYRSISYVYCEYDDVANGLCPYIGLILSVNDGISGVPLLRYQYYLEDDNECASGTRCMYRSGDLRRLIRRDGYNVVYAEYDAAGRLVSSVDIEGVSIRYEYNGDGLLLTKIEKGLSAGSLIQKTWSFTYSGGLIRNMVMPGGREASFSYDGAGRLVSVMDGSGNVLDYELDGSGNIVQQVISGADGHIKYLKLVDVLPFSAGVRERNYRGDMYSMIANNPGGLVSFVQPDGVRGVKVYDLLGRLVRVANDVDEINATTIYKYDIRDNLIEVVDPAGKSTKYGYNSFGDVVSVISPDAGFFNYRYDAQGRLLSREGPVGSAGYYSYDENGRLESIERAGPDSVFFSYDFSGSACGSDNVSGSDRLAMASYNYVETSYCYDSFGQPIMKKDKHLSGVSLSTAYRYRDDGQVASISYPSGAVVSYEYDSGGEISKVVLGNHTSAGDILSGVKRNPFGGYSRWIYGDGEVLTRSYDYSYRPIRVELRLNFQVQRPHIGPLPCPEPINT